MIEIEFDSVSTGMIPGMPGRFCQLALQLSVELLCVIKGIQHSKYLDYLPNNSLFVVFTIKKMAVCAVPAYLYHFSHWKSGKKVIQTKEV